MKTRITLLIVVTFCLVTLANAQTPKETTVFGQKIHYVEAGSGPNVILLHGLGGSTQAWQFNIGPLAEKFHVWLGPAAADVHDIAGPELRGLGIGVYFFAVIIAYGIGSLVIGQLNDWLGATITPLNMRFSMLLCPLACLVAALSLWQGSRAAKHVS